VDAISTDLGRLEREAFHTSNDTGYEELTRAVMFFALAWMTLAFRLVAPVGSDGWFTQFTPAVILLPPTVIFLWIDKLKRRDVAQRLGTFKPSRARRQRQQIAVVISLGITVAGLVFAPAKFGDVSHFSGGRLAALAITFGICGLVVAQLTEQPRQRYLGWLMGIGSGVWLGFGSGLLSTLAMTAVGTTFLAIGLVVVRRFHRKHPVLSTAGHNVRA